MSLSATCSDVAIPKPGLQTPTLLIIIWLDTVMTQLLTGFVRGNEMSTDDAMRLVEVRDLLAGQAGSI
jgi:hypothetical protein